MELGTRNNTDERSGERRTRQRELAGWLAPVRASVSRYLMDGVGVWPAPRAAGGAALGEALVRTGDTDRFVILCQVWYTSVCKPGSQGLWKCAG